MSSARNPVEQRLAEIWRQVLGLEQVGVHDNFFELGGDSILSIQIVSRANQAGLRLTPKAGLRASDDRRTGAGGGCGAGGRRRSRVASRASAPLTAIQQWFFEQEFADPHHFNQSVLLRRREALNPDMAAKRGARRCQAHHDALRLRFVRRDGGWQQEDTAADSPTVFFTGSTCPASIEAEQAAALETAAAEVQASLNLDAGRSVAGCAVQAGGGRGQRLLLVIHHLVVDGVSWRILLEDLQTAYEQASRGQTIQPSRQDDIVCGLGAALPRACGIGCVARGAAVLAVRTAAHGWPTSGGRSARRQHGRFGRSVTVSLSAAETEALLREVPDVYRTQINDVLLTALTEAFCGLDRRAVRCCSTWRGTAAKSCSRTWTCRARSAGSRRCIRCSLEREPGRRLQARR